MKFSMKDVTFKTVLYWSVELIGLLILGLSLVAKIKPFLPAKEKKEDAKKDSTAKE